ncbi:uncharacterized protein (DUF1684 family) [Microbacterium resistens]|uniref:Uncharacterized protein (DUF1684 family) n=1 Tax=Microbacterium resistens TaxID=156977 RepID=A0ABU1SFJ0_9MICO|nr:DUF1684 domain-containing protein [Microbacterium resistens]MDR6868386.1 uncharacterized protein (DUF1684 family) [Microbacterium resistens]
MPENQAPSDAELRTAHEDWTARRIGAVTAPQGNLALIETRWLEPGETVTTEEAAAPLPDSVSVTELTRRHLTTGELEHGLRFWDADSPRRRAFQGIETFPYDPAWRLAGTFIPVEGGRTVPSEHLRDNGLTRDHAVPGDLVVTIDGTEYALDAFDNDGTLLLVFGDPTNRTEDPSTRTYGPGRFLVVHHEEDASDGPRPVVLDFNRSFVPPCGFSDQYNCPLPPASNRIATPVTAGERFPLFSPEADPTAGSEAGSGVGGR